MCHALTKSTNHGLEERPEDPVDISGFWAFIFVGKFTSVYHHPGSVAPTLNKYPRDSLFPSVLTDDPVAGIWNNSKACIQHSTGKPIQHNASALLRCVPAAAAATELCCHTSAIRMLWILDYFNRAQWYWMAATPGGSFKRRRAISWSGTYFIRHTQSKAHFSKNGESKRTWKPKYSTFSHSFEARPCKFYNFANHRSALDICRLTQKLFSGKKTGHLAQISSSLWNGNLVLPCPRNLARLMPWSFQSWKTNPH